MLGWLWKKKKDPSLPSNFKSLLDSDALKIVKTLQKNNYESYIVGGCVRDLLNGEQPKDYDIATSASPQKVKNLVSHSFIIGRRFRIVVAKRKPSFNPLAHKTNFPPLLKGGKPNDKEIQITTFRRAPEIHEDKINENVFGSAKDDAFRRDFTINGLFLDPSTGRIVDYVGGLEDMKKRQLRIIGNPIERFKEDPIRILRALRFAVRSQFNLEEQTEKALRKSLHLLADAKKERVREEILKFLKEGTAPKAFAQLYEWDAWKFISPVWDGFLKENASLRELFFESSGAVDKAHWDLTFGAAPLLYLFLYPLTQAPSTLRLKNGKNIDQILQSIADDLKISKIEKEEIQFIHGSLKSMVTKPNWEFPLTPKESYILRQIQFSLVLHSLALFRPDDYANAWKRFESPWRSHCKWIVATLQKSHERTSSDSSHRGHKGPLRRKRRRSPRSRSSEKAASPIKET